MKKYGNQMKNITGLLVVVLMHYAFVHTAIAQDEKKALVPLPSLDDFHKGEDAGALQWRSGNNIFFWAGEALGWRGLRSETWLLEATVGFDEGREESDSEDGHLDGLGDGEEGIELVLQARRAFDTDWRYWLDGRVVSGTLRLIGVGRRFGDQKDGTGHEIAIALVFHDSDYANKDFGVTAEQSAASGLDESNLSGGFRSVGFNYNYRQYVAEKWQIFGEAVYELYSSEIQDSPISRSNYEAEIGIGFIYVF